MNASTYDKTQLSEPRQARCISSDLPCRTGIDPVVFCTTDDRYAMPLAVTLSSAADHLRVGRRLTVYLVDAGLSDESHDRLAATLSAHAVSLHVVPADSADLRDLSISHHISHTAYLRLLADRWLPSDLERVIYLDSDLLVQDCLAELWDWPLEDRAVLAAPDIACPYIDARIGCRNFRKASPYMACLAPISNHRDVGVPPDQHYFNSGVMVMNLRRWRAEGLGARLIECLRRNRKHIWCWDQYALNVILAGDWGRLPLRWNVGAHAYEYPSSSHAPIDQREFEESVERPAILHFTTEFKPWNYHSSHPLRDRFFAAVDRTAWRGWRPSRPPFRLGDWWQRRAVHIAKHWTIAYRKVSAWRMAEHR